MRMPYLCSTPSTSVTPDRSWEAILAIVFPRSPLYLLSTLKNHADDTYHRIAFKHGQMAEVAFCHQVHPVFHSVPRGDGDNRAASPSFAAGASREFACPRGTSPPSAA